MLHSHNLVILFAVAEFVSEVDSFLRFFRQLPLCIPGRFASIGKSLLGGIEVELKLFSRRFEFICPSDFCLDQSA
jgi:hypothetical protein